MTLREAAQQALEALEWYAKGAVGSRKAADAAEVLRAALEQPEQKPVAWWNPQYGTDSYAFSDEKSDEWRVPLYTHPPRREWRGLTDEEKRECAQAMDAEPLAEGWPELVKFARAVEAKLKELNHD